MKKTLVLLAFVLAFSTALFGTTADYSSGTFVSGTCLFNSCPSAKDGLAFVLDGTSSNLAVGLTAGEIFVESCPDHLAGKCWGVQEINNGNGAGFADIVTKGGEVIFGNILASGLLDKVGNNFTFYGNLSPVDGIPGLVIASFTLGKNGVMTTGNFNLLAEVPQITPEPAPLLTLGLGLIGIAFFGRKTIWNLRTQ